MKKLIAVSLIMAVTFLTWGSVASVYAQDTAKDDKPTFYHLVPGTYVNGWPRFTITYPKDWVEGHLLPQEVFRAGVPGPPGGVIALHVSPFPFRVLQLDKVASHLLPFAQSMDKDAIVVSDKPSQTRDGTPAREVDIQWGHGEGHWLTLGTKKDDCWINMGVYAPHKIGEDLKAILYSLRYEPGMDKPVTVPADIREFLDKFSSDMVSHDLAKVMTHYSDRFLNSGTTKKETEESTRQVIGSIKSFEISIIEFVPAGDKVYLAGFATSNAGKEPIKGVSIIKENGEWKWYGNQREAISFS